MKLLLDILENIVIIVFVVYIVGGLVLYNFLYWLFLKNMIKDGIMSQILNALVDRYNAQISEAKAILEIYLNKSVGIGEHPQHLDEVDKLIVKIATAKENLMVIEEIRDI